MKYNNIILNDLMSIYEKRDANSSNFKTKVKIKITDKTYPKYFDDPSGFDESIKELKNQGYIEYKLIPHDTVIDYIYLNLDKVDEIKSLLGIKGVSNIREKVLDELNKYDDDIIVNLKNDILERINNNKSVKQYLSDDFIDAIKVVHYLENLNHDVYERNASNFIFNDSKRISKIKSLICSIYNNDNILEEKGMMSVTPYLYVKGEGIIHINQQIIDLSLVGTSIALPIDDVSVLDFERINKVTTIENLTTFYDYKSDGLIVYLGGFSTRNQKAILNKIKSICNDFYHFGDIDYGGFTILNDLMEYLNIDINAINMDLNTLKSNIKFAQKFNEDSYTQKLESLLSKPRLKKHYDVIRFLIENKIWLEQESFYNL